MECAIPGEHLEEHGPKSEDIGARISGLAANVMIDGNRSALRRVIVSILQRHGIAKID